MKPTRGYSSPGCHSTFATTWRGRSQLCALVVEARVEASDIVRGSPHGPREERRDPFLEHGVGGQADRVLEALRLQILVQVRQGEGRVPPAASVGGPGRDTAPPLGRAP